MNGMSGVNGMRGARSWLILLAACAVTFAATSIYLWHELAQARAQPPRVVNTIPPTIQVVRPPAKVSGSAGKSAAMHTAAIPAAKALDPNVEPDEYQRQQSRQLLEQLANPAEHARLLEEAKVGVRNAYPWLAERLKLSPDEYEKLVETLASSSLEARAAAAKCTVDPGCNPGEYAQANYDQRAQLVADLLGPERTKQFETYQQTMNERETVLNLRGRLPDQAWLSTEQSESLITALADESWQAQRDAVLAGQSFVGFGMNGGWIYYRDQGTTEQQMQSAEAWVNRMNARAAQILTADQQRYFTQIQQDLLANLRNQLETIEHEKQ